MHWFVPNALIPGFLIALAWRLVAALLLSHLTKQSLAVGCGAELLHCLDKTVWMDKKVCKHERIQ